MLHDMGRSLAISRSYESARWWPEVYRKAFPSMKAYISVRDDGWAQRAGIDRYVVLESGRIIPIDEKVREKDYGDILLERWSNEERKIPGWVHKGARLRVYRLCRDSHREVLALANTLSAACMASVWPVLDPHLSRDKSAEFQWQRQVRGRRSA